MAASFLPPSAQPPQPGDGAFLLHNPAGASGARRRARGKKKARSFLPDTAEVEPEKTTSLHHHPSGPLSSFLPRDAFDITSSDGTRHEPRTIAAQQTFPSPPDWNQRTAPTDVRTPIRSTVSDPQQQNPHYTVAPTLEHSDSDSMAPGTKGLPPHLRKKAAAAASSTTAQKEPTQPKHESRGVRQNSAGEFGVKVAEPKTALVAYSASGDESVNRIDSAGSNRVKEVQAATAVQVSTPTGHDQPKLHEPASKHAKQVAFTSNASVGVGNALSVQDDVAHPFRGRGKGHNQRGGREGRGSRRAPRQERWPKKSDFPVPDPKRWETKWESEKSLNSSNVDSVEADSGFGEGKKKRAPADAGGFKLTDFNGQWAPAPLNWDARPEFRDPAKLGRIESWIEVVEGELSTESRALVRDEAVAHEDEVVPSYWVPKSFPAAKKTSGSPQRMTPRAFWDEIRDSKTPPPMDEMDLVNARPWWEKVKVLTETTYLHAIEQPDIKGIDPDETRNEKIARENDRGSANHTQNRHDAEKAKRQAQQEKRRRAEEKARKYRETAAQTQYERIKPGLNMYVRPARASDMIAVRDIYNHYVENTCCAPEIDRRTDIDMLNRYTSIQSNHLPFLVACARGGKVNARRRRRDPDNELWLPDTVIGFAYADDFADLTGMYRFTVEIDVYVDKQHYMKSIAKCLLDKLMAMLDPAYVEHGGFDIEGDELDGMGPSRLLQNVVVNVPYDKPERLEWISRWLTSWLGFQQKGVLVNVGNKNGKSVNVAIFQRKTGVEIDAANPPIGMQYPT